jgi:hypothetical protein
MAGLNAVLSLSDLNDLGNADELEAIALLVDHALEVHARRR